jgi:DNA-binding IclR family transcriptional regulator
MDLELSRIFPNEQMRSRALLVISCLSKYKEPVNQKTLAELIGINEMALSRILSILESNGYIKRENTASGKFVRLM